MKKRTRKLALNKETVLTLSEPALEQVAGGRIREGMTGDPTDCICPGNPVRLARFRRIFEIRIRK